MDPEKTEDYELMERLVRAYREVGFPSQEAAVARAREFGVMDVDQPLLSDWMLAVENENVSRTTRKRPALQRMVEAFEALASQKDAVRPVRSRELIREIRARLDELEEVLPTGPSGRAGADRTLKDALELALQGKKEEALKLIGRRRSG